MGIFDFLKKSKDYLDGNTQVSSLFTGGSKSPNLSVGEISFLEYMSGHDTDITTFSKTFKYNYDLNYKKTVDKMTQKGYVRIGTIEESLSVYTIPSLKDFLKSKGLSISGTKNILINRILSETTGYEDHFTKRVYILTEKGKEVIDKFHETQIDNLKKETLDTISYIRNDQLNKLIDIYGSGIVETISAIKKYCSMGHDTDRELSIAILDIIFNQSYSSLKLNMENIGYNDISDSEVYTISTSIHTLIELEEFKKIGIKKYKVSTCRDQRVCEKCAKHDNKIYLVSKAKPGKSAPPFCDKCRCIIMAEFDLRDEG